MEQGLSGGTTNLLRMARTGCQSGSSFVALALTDDSFATAVYPATPEPGAVDVPTVDAVVRQLWHDPGFGRGKALVRSVRIGTDRLAVAAVPLGLTDQGQPSGVLGVVDPGGKSFGVPDLELLSRIAQRLTSYVQARRAVRSQLAHAAAPERRTGSEAWSPAPEPAASQSREAPAATAPNPAVGVTQDERQFGASAAFEAPGGEVEAGRPVHSNPLWSDEPDAGRLPLPPFPPPAGTAGVGRVAGAAGTRPRVIPVEAPSGAPTSAGAPARTATGTPRPASALAQDDPLRSLLEDDGEIEGLVPLGALLGRAGRLLGAGTAMSGSLAVLILDVENVSQLSTEEVARVARAMRTELRFDDPLARIGDLSFVAVVPLAPGGSSAAEVEAHLAARLRNAVAARQGARVHAAHVVAPLDGGQDADELLRAAVVKLRAH
jgi:hypothetical protein